MGRQEAREPTGLAANPFSKIIFFNTQNQTESMSNERVNFTTEIICVRKIASNIPLDPPALTMKKRIN